ncbi:hypothetical protein RS030_91570 [Cryptosporidium xiaoi]|uniref:Peptidase C1A papain C-terminal domain-containing protein n=1 Tax=Cryptosporidium xiaoi TaxID=659607 RepID=A0AAV9XUJ4_9CRYT
MLLTFAIFGYLAYFVKYGNGLVLNKTDINEYSNDEMYTICELVWNETEKLGYNVNRNQGACINMIKDVYKLRKLMPMAEFDLTKYSVLTEEVEDPVNTDIYTGNLTLITGRNGDEIESLVYGKALYERILNSKIPDNFDLRSNNANLKEGGSCITFPDNQGKCANCYNYSALSSIEGAFCRQLGVLIPQLSQQNSLDCWLKKKGAKKACNGGQTFEVYNYALKSKVCTKDSYPPTTFKTGKVGICNASCNQCASINDFMWNYTGSSSNYEDPWEVITHAIYNYGPVTVSICSLMPGFNYYSGGFYEPPTCGSIWCGTRQVDHAVTLVGYGKTHEGRRYYIMKNSWGVGWGNKGFMNISADMCSTFFNPAWVTSVKLEDISEHCSNNKPKISEIANINPKLNAIKATIAIISQLILQLQLWLLESN